MATESAVVYTKDQDTRSAARELAQKTRSALPGRPPDALILFAAPRYDHSALLRTLMDGCAPGVLVGASSAGEFTSDQRGEGLACALALRSDVLRFSAGVGREMSRDRAAAARSITSGFRGMREKDHAYRSALVMTDALAGHADDLVDQLTLATAGKYQFFGGGAGDDAQFRRTQVFFGAEALSDAAVALEILSDKPIGIGVGHGWQPASPPLRVTQAEGMNVVGLNGMPAVEAFEQHAQRTGQAFDATAPLPFFLHNILGIETGSGHRLRVPLAVGKDGSIACAAEVPTGATVHIMRTDANSAVEAATRATKAAIAGLGGHTPQVALFFDCVATRLRMGEVFGLELESLAKSLGAAEYVGCNTHGQIARAAGQFGGFHNCTAVVCVLPG
jgi:hypothetical protein